MRRALWPTATASQHRGDMREYRRQRSKAVFVAARSTGKLVGFLEASIRSVADGCATAPVGYIEGWYVDADVRRQGIGERLVRAAEAWAQAKQMREMGSDCLLDNDVSRRAHVAIGYEERERLIHFRKWLSSRRPRTNR